MKLGVYDAALQMFVETPHTLEYRHLQFYRWLAVNGRLEHPVAGRSIMQDTLPERMANIPQYTGKQ